MFSDRHTHAGIKPELIFIQGECHEPKLSQIISVDMMGAVGYTYNSGIGLAAEHLTPDQTSHSHIFRNKQQGFIMSVKNTQKLLRKLTVYYPETGVFFNRKTGRLLGCLNKGPNQGYWAIHIGDIQGNRSRLAWIYMEGYDPKGYDIDHKNRIRHDDKWCNLRLATRQCNSRNCNLKKANKSGITGVFFSPRYQKWEAQIGIDKKTYYLGRYDTKIDAARARWQAEKDNNFPDCNTYSTAYLYLKNEGAL